MKINWHAESKIEGQAITNQTQPIKFDDFANIINDKYLKYQRKKETKGLKFDDFSTWVNTGKFERG